MTLVPMTLDSKLHRGPDQRTEWETFLADRTIGRAFGTLCRLSVCRLSVTFCIVAKRYVLAKNCLKEQIGNAGPKSLILGVATIFLLPVSPPRPQRRPFCLIFARTAQR